MSSFVKRVKIKHLETYLLYRAVDLVKNLDILKSSCKSVKIVQSSQNPTQYWILR